MVRLLDWLTNLELDWEHSAWTPLYEALAARSQLIRYDAPGMGLSDRDITDFRLDAKVRARAAVVDAAGLDRFALLERLTE